MLKNLARDFDKLVKKYFDEYIDKVSTKFSISKKDLEDILNNIVEDSEKVENNTNKKEEKVENKKEKVENKKEKVEKKTNKIEKESNSNSCPYVFSKGENKGEICGSKPKTGCEYCSKHQKFEGVGQNEKKQLPKAKTSPTPRKTKNSPEKKPIEKVIRLNKEIDKWWDSDTELIFKSRDERIVIGSYRDGKINNLTDDDILLCEKFGFRYERKEEEKLSVSDNEIDNEDESDDENTKIITKKKPEKIVHKVIEKPKIVENSKLEKLKNIETNIKKDKKNISSEINNIYAKDIENVLKELQNSKDDYSSEEELLDEEEEEEEEYYEEED
jgi:hypothetical protein